MLRPFILFLPLCFAVGCNSASPEKDAQVTCSCIEKALEKDGQAYKTAMDACVAESKEIDQKYSGTDSEKLKSTRKQCGKPLFKRAAEKDRKRR